ncbi:MAG: hypothetical protein LBD73_07220 [Deferribacteraceae bacterium]|nr:hypothetical protein [Deferribacteraceae bacterium]
MKHGKCRRISDTEQDRSSVANTEGIPTATVFVGRSAINRIWGNQPDKPHIGDVASNADGGRERTQLHRQDNAGWQEPQTGRRTEAGAGNAARNTGST